MWCVTLLGHFSDTEKESSLVWEPKYYWTKLGEMGQVIWKWRRKSWLLEQFSLSVCSQYINPTLPLPWFSIINTYICLFVIYFSLLSISLLPHDKAAMWWSVGFDKVGHVLMRSNEEKRYRPAHVYILRVHTLSNHYRGPSSCTHCTQWIGPLVWSPFLAPRK